MILTRLTVLLECPENLLAPRGIIVGTCDEEGSAVLAEGKLFGASRCIDIPEDQLHCAVVGVRRQSQTQSELDGPFDEPSRLANWRRSTFCFALRRSIFFCRFRGSIAMTAFLA